MRIRLEEIEVIMENNEHTPNLYKAAKYFSSWLRGLNVHYLSDQTRSMEEVMISEVCTYYSKSQLLKCLHVFDVPAPADLTGLPLPIFHKKLSSAIFERIRQSLTNYEPLDDILCQQWCRQQKK